MRKYRCHKVVEAAPVVAIVRAEIVGNLSHVKVENEDGSHEAVEVPEDFFARGIPMQGDYLVRYGAGSDASPDVGGTYLSWSPKAVFEAGYTAE